MKRRPLTDEDRARRANFLREGRRSAARKEAPSRPHNSTAGSWVTDLAEIRQTVLLCPDCEPKFFAKPYDYEKVQRFTDNWGGVYAKCDGCREVGFKRSCYAHSTLSRQI